MRDWSLPGYKYLGPGNKLDKGKPNNRNDDVAYHHDVAYDKYIKKGKNPYLSYNDADDKARAEFTFDDYGGAAGKAFFTGKRAAWKMGLIGNLDQPAAKRLRGSNRESIKKEAASVENSTREAPSVMSGSGSGGGADGAGSGNNLGLKETPIDDVINVSRGPPDYTFASLPYISFRKYFDSAIYTADLAFRMTSPYDCYVGASNAAIPGTGSGSTLPQQAEPDALANKARWYDYYSTLYKYYHVVACRYNVYIENLSGEPLWAHMMFYNNEIPPQGATNEDILLWKGVRSQYLVPQYRAVVNTGSISTVETEQPISNMNEEMNEADGQTWGTSNYQTGNHVTSRSGHVSTSFSGTYRPGDFKREIILDSDVENWTSINTNPTLTERLLIRLKPDNPGLDAANPRGDTVHAKIIVKLEYLVEFKELNAGLRWPVQRQPLSVTINQSVTSATA